MVKSFRSKIAHAMLAFFLFSVIFFALSTVRLNLSTKGTYPNLETRIFPRYIWDSGDSQKENDEILEDGVHNTNWITRHDYYMYDVQKEEPIDKDQICLLPKFHPFHPSVVKYVNKMYPIHCKRLQAPLTYVDLQGYLKFNGSEVQKGTWKGLKLTCVYSEVLRANAPETDNFEFNTSKPFTGSCSVSHADFIKVECTDTSSVVVYLNIHTNIRKIPIDASKVGNIKQKYNVLVFGIDSLSRLNAMRQLPKTFKYLREVMKSFIFRGFQKVGSNTFPNVATMLTGWHPFQEPVAYLPREIDNEPHDPWPFIWKNFSNAGYRTMFAEDEPMYNAFHFSSGGFNDQPTDHYARTFWTAVEASVLTSSSTKFCFGNQAEHDLQLEYIKRLISSVSGKQPFWLFSWLTKVSHSFVNTIGIADDSFYRFFKHLNEEGYLNNTVVMFLGDHGQRFGDIRYTYVGSIEDKMPLFMLSVPESLKRSQPHILKNLQANMMRLTSPFDIYCTMMEVLKLSVDSSYKTGDYKTLHGISMFDEIPKNRTCSSAGVADSFCACKREKNVPVSSKNVTIVTNFLINSINKMIISEYKDYKLCAQLRLEKVRKALHIGYSEGFQDHADKTFKVTFEASPSKGVFEGTVRVSNYTRIELVGEIERINRYGNQSRCISHRLLRVFCYCH